MPEYRRGLSPANRDSDIEYLKRELQKIEYSIRAIYKTIDTLKGELISNGITVSRNNE